MTLALIYNPTTNTVVYLQRYKELRSLTKLLKPNLRRCRVNVRQFLRPLKDKYTYTFVNDNHWLLLIFAHERH